MEVDKFIKFIKIIKIIKMKNTTLSIAFIVLAVSLNAQIRQISVGAEYRQQTYINLSTGESFSLDNEAWDIAFTAQGQQDGGVFINESSSLSGAPIELYHAEGLTWEDPITDTSPYVDSVRIHNNEKNWLYGAFNDLRNVSDPFDYGWGAYNPQAQQVEGSLVFVIKKRNGTLIKFQISALDINGYQIRYADLDGSNEVSKTVSKAIDNGDKLIHFSFDTNDIVTIPSDYDIIFQRYTRPLDDMQGGLLEYVVTGVMLAPGVEAVIADGIDPADVDEEDYASDYSTSPIAIGHEWKYFDFNQGWVMETDEVYFVKARDGKKYRLLFLDFEGSSTGTTTVEIAFLGTSATNEELSWSSSIEVYPNPFINQISVKGDESFASAFLELYNSSGQKIVSGQANSGTLFLSAGLPMGTYYLSIEKDGKKIIKKLVR